MAIYREEESERRKARPVDRILADMDEVDERISKLSKLKGKLQAEYNIATEDRIPKVF